MTNSRRREEWEQDIASRQRNVVFPDTVYNEARFWQNLGSQPWNIWTKLGLGVLGLFVFGFLAVILRASFHEGAGWLLVLGLILLWGPIFGLIAWATRRNLRNLQAARRTPRSPKK